MSLARAAILAALALSSRVADAQPVRVDPSLRLGPVPSHRGEGVPVRWVHGYFAGFPFHIDDARDLLDEVAVIPAFETWCGALPYISLGNRSAWDSLGRGAPTMLCAPFLDPAETSDFTCRALPGVPGGRYWRNGGAAMRARGALAVREAGVYTFAWGHDDGLSFRIGATRVYEFPDGTAPRVDVAVVRFEEAGLYPFTLEWFDGIGGALLDWYVASGERRVDEFSNFSFALVPTADLYAVDGRECTADCRSCASPASFCDRSLGRCVACTAREGCGACARCEAGSCVADPTRDGCATDAGAAFEERSGDASEAAVVDASEHGDGPLNRVASDRSGCGCATPRHDSSRWSLALALAFGVGWRRRKR